MAKSGVYNFSHAELDSLEYAGPIRYFSQEEIEEMSPSRRDGIDLKKERSLQASYCNFLQKLGMQLKVSQITISSAMAYCHRFYLQQSHAKNDRMTIATACMFIAAKVGESFRPLRDIVPVAYEIINQKDLLAVWKIKRKKVYEGQKALILLAEGVVLVALAFNFSVSLPYRPLLNAVRKFNGADNFFVQVAWNFVNDCFRTSLCLRCKAQHIAAGAFFLAAKFTKVKLPFKGAFWLQEFNITSQQLEEITSQMMDLYVVRGPLAIEREGSTGHDHIATSSTAGGNLVYDSGHSQAPSPKLHHLLGSGLPDA